MTEYKALENIVCDFKVNRTLCGDFDIRLIIILVQHMPVCVKHFKHTWTCGHCKFLKIFKSNKKGLEMLSVHSIFFYIFALSPKAQDKVQT